MTITEEILQALLYFIKGIGVIVSTIVLIILFPLILIYDLGKSFSDGDEF